MQINIERLKKYLTSFLATLQDIHSNATGIKTGDHDIPHMEMIDFDELSAVLHDTLAELETAFTHARDGDIVRKWFLDRIASMDRGRQALLGVSVSERDPGLSENLPLPELARRFEEASARLRSTAVNHNFCRKGDVYRTADSFKPFKS